MPRAPRGGRGSLAADHWLAAVQKQEAIWLFPRCLLAAKVKSVDESPKESLLDGREAGSLQFALSR